MNYISRFIFCVIATIAFACDRAPSKQVATPATAQSKPADRHEFDEIEFVPPVGWSLQKVMGGVLITSPEVVGDWQANIFLEMRKDAQLRSPEQAVHDLIPNLKLRKRYFQEVGREVRSHRNGLRYATLEYTCDVDQSAVIETEAVFELKGEKRLFVLTSVPAIAMNRYRPILQEFTDSIRSTQR